MTVTTFGYWSFYCKYRLKDKIWLIQNGYSRLNGKLNRTVIAKYTGLHSAVLLFSTPQNWRTGLERCSFLLHNVSQNGCSPCISSCNVNLLIEGASTFVSEIPMQNQFKLFSVEKLGHVFLTISSPKDKFIRR